MVELPPNATLSDALRAAARHWGDAPALMCEAGSFSHAQVLAKAEELARALVGLGLRRGERLGLLAGNQLEWLQVFYAAAQLGVAVVALSARYREGELRHMLRDAEVSVLITVPEAEGFDFVQMAQRLQPELPQLRTLVRLAPEGASAAGALPVLSWPALMAHASTVSDQALAEASAGGQASDLAMVIYTSGTTGTPKGAGLTHASMLASARAQARHTRAAADDHQQLALPLNHVGGITCGVLTRLFGGGCIELVPVFKADDMLARMAQRPPTVMGGVPTMLTLLLMQPPNAQAWSRVRLVVVGGSSVDEGLLDALRARLPGATFMNLYGMSETSGAIVMTPFDAPEDALMQSIGKPFAEAEMKVVDPLGDVVAAGDVGELCFRGCGVVPGYIGAARANAAFDAEGWVHSGDLASVDERGFVMLRGRQKDMYIQGGYNVYPAEVESLISRYPGVAMVAGIGVADPVLGEVGRFYLVAQPGAAIDLQALRAYCAEHLADYKVPRQFELRADLPLTPAGKIQKAALRSEVQV